MQIGCERRRRSEAFVKIRKKKSRGVQSGVGVGEGGVARFGVGGGCKPRIKGIDKCK